MNGLDSAKCQKSRKRDMMGILKIINDNKTKDEQCHLLEFEPKMGSGWTGCAKNGDLRFLEREKEHILSRFSVDRTISFRWSKK